MYQGYVHYIFKKGKKSIPVCVLSSFFLKIFQLRPNNGYPNMFVPYKFTSLLWTWFPAAVSAVQTV